VFAEHATRVVFLVKPPQSLVANGLDQSIV
jgi:hypothetical protein